MTLQELIDILLAVHPTSARDAHVFLSMSNEKDFEPLSVRYEDGFVMIQVEEA